MKVVSFLAALVCTSASLLYSQIPTNAIPIAGRDTVQLKALYEQQRELSDKREINQQIADAKERIRITYTTTEDNSLLSTTWCDSTRVCRRVLYGWEYGIVFSMDYKYIIPETLTNCVMGLNTGCTVNPFAPVNTNVTSRVTH